MTKRLYTLLKIFVFCIFAATAGLTSVTVAKAGELNFHAVYVGRGDALILESDGHYMIVDSGTSDGVDYLMPYLESLDIEDNKIDCVVATHPDGDHVGGFYEIFQEYEVEQIYISPCSKVFDSYVRFINYCKDEGCPITTPSTGDTWQLGDATVEVIYDGTLGSTYNESSLVLKVTCDGKSILLTGDLPSTIERKLIANGADLSADILKVGHHGAALSSCADFLDAVSPDYAVISCPDPSVSNMPKASVLKRLARRFVKTYKTTDGNILITIKNGVISTTAEDTNPYTCIKLGTIKFASSSKIYATGSKITPEVSLYVNGTLVPSSNYTITYSSNKNPGVAKVKITADNNTYLGSVSTTFKIYPASMTPEVANYTFNRIKLTWSKQTNTTNYRIQYSTSSDFSNYTKVVVSSGKVSKILKNLDPDTKYYIRFRAYCAESGLGKWCKKIKVTTKSAPVPKKASIKSCQSNTAKSITVTWATQAKKYNAGYKIAVSTSKKFKKKKTTVYTVKKASKTSKKIKKLTSGKTYYIRIRGYNDYGKGKWSKKVKITVGE